MLESSPNFEEHPLGRLPLEDLDFIVRLTLASGSLKELARQYGVSYPTIRARLDRLIERLQQALQGRRPDPYLEQLAELVDAGDLTPRGARRLRDLHLEQMRGREG